jgi:hypothetical protein
MLCTVKLRAYYVPAASVCLLSTTDLMHKTGEKLEGDTSCLRLTGLPGGPNSIQAPIALETNLPTTYIYDYRPNPMVVPPLICLPIHPLARLLIRTPKMVILGAWTPLNGPSESPRSWKFDWTHWESTGPTRTSS